MQMRESDLKTKRLSTENQDAYLIFRMPLRCKYEYDLYLKVRKSSILKQDSGLI